MSNLTFRPRPLDIHKQMPIVKTEENIDPYEGVSRSVPQMPTGMDPEDEEEQHIQEAIARSLQPSLQPSEIPTPNCRIVEEYINEKVEPWEPTPTFLLFHDPTESELEQMVEYDLDPEDTKFLQELNSPKKQLTEDALEFLIDRLEKFKRRCKRNGETNFTVAKVEKLLVKERHNHNIKPAALAAVFKYWLKKRQRIKVALIPRFQKPPDFNDPSPLVAFRPREPAIKPKKIHNRKNDSSAFNKLTQLRREFERARMLLEMIKKREKTKRERIGVLRDIFEYKLTEPASEREKKKRRNDEKSGTTSKPAKRSKIDRTYGFDVETSSSSEPSSPIPSSPAPPPVDTPELMEMIRKPPPCPYPVYLGKRIAVGGDVPLFRGRARIGRGGRLIFDRYSIPWVTLRANERHPISEEEWAQAMEEEEEAEEENETETNRAGFWGNGESEEKATTKQEEESGDLDGRDEYPLQQNGIQGEESRNGGEIIEMEEEEEEDKESDGEMGNAAASKGREFVGFGVRKLGAEGKSEKQNGKRHAVQQKPYLTFELGNGESSFSKRLREITNMDGGSSDHERDEADDELSDTEANGKGWGVSQGNGVQHTGNAVK